MEVAEKYKLYRHIRFNSTVDEASWDEEELKWKTKVAVSGAKDSEYSQGYTITSDFLVSAVGQLNAPQYPNIPGLDEFQGKKMHSARWDWSYGLDGKRIAIIGNGTMSSCCLSRVKLIFLHSRCHISSDNSRNSKGRLTHYRVSANTKLGYPSERWAGRATITRCIPLLTTGQMALACAQDGYSGELLCCRYGYRFGSRD